MFVGEAGNTDDVEVVCEELDPEDADENEFVWEPLPFFLMRTGFFKESKNFMFLLNVDLYERVKRRGERGTVRKANCVYSVLVIWLAMSNETARRCLVCTFSFRWYVSRG